MSKLPTPTRHAAERYQERVDPTASLGLAWRAIERNMTRAVKIPLRYAKERWTTRDAPIPKRVNMDWWLSAEMLTVVVSGRIVTLWEVTDDDDIATGLVWITMRTWVGDRGDQDGTA